MNNSNKFLSSHWHLLSNCIYRWTLWRNMMARAILGTVQIRPTMLDAEGLCSRVNKESIQYEFMMQVISSFRKLARTKWHQIFSPDMQGYSYYVANHDFKVVLILFTWNSVIVELTQQITIFGLNNKLLDQRNTTSVCNILKLA